MNTHTNNFLIVDYISLPHPRVKNVTGYRVYVPHNYFDFDNLEAAFDYLRMNTETRIIVALYISNMGIVSFQNDTVIVETGD